MRISKYLAACGIASRRAAEKIVLEGRISVDGVCVTELATKLTGNEKVMFDGMELILPSKIRVWKFYKPKGALTTRKDPKSRQTIYDLLPREFANIITIGRLDFNTEGLLLLTNNGDFARFMELPSSGIKRVYMVRVFGHVTKEMISEIKYGITLHDGTRYKPCEIECVDCGENLNRWFKITLFEGKNREIRNIFQHFGLTVSRLIRIQYGDYSLNSMKVGEVIEDAVIIQ